MSDVDAICYLNRTIVPVIGIQSLRTQRLELSRPSHQPNDHAPVRAMRCAVPTRGAENTKPAQGPRPKTRKVSLKTQLPEPVARMGKLNGRTVSE